VINIDSVIGRTNVTLAEVIPLLDRWPADNPAIVPLADLRALIGNDAPADLGGLRLRLTLDPWGSLVDAALYGDAIRPHRVSA
jgi:hypothetical protein